MGSEMCIRDRAWPSPGIAEVHVSYGPTVTDQAAITRALTEPYYDAVADTWRMSPFQIQGYDPLTPLSLPDTAAP